MMLVTGGAGFIGADFDKLTYAGNLDNLSGLQGRPEHCFVRGDIGDHALVADLLQRHQPRALIHFAAESHVDRSIDAPEDFVRTNVLGTCPCAGGASYRGQIRFVEDRPGHDRRYAVDAGKLTSATGWRPAESFETGLRRVGRVADGSYRQSGA